MTLDQAIAALLAIGVTVIARLVNRWLPPSDSGAAAALSHSVVEPMAGYPPTPPTPPPSTPPDSSDLDVRD